MEPDHEVRSVATSTSERDAISVGTFICIPPHPVAAPKNAIPNQKPPTCRAISAPYTKLRRGSSRLTPAAPEYHPPSPLFDPDRAKQSSHPAPHTRCAKPDPTDR